MKKIIFRADGDNTIGLGHLYRIYALIEMFRSNAECLIVCKQSTVSVIPKEYTYLAIPDSVSLEDEPQWMFEQLKSEAFLIIADGYHFNAVWQKKIKQLAFKFMYIDDLCRDEMYADIVVNHALNVKSAEYQSQYYTQFALGTKYAILRPLFLKAAGEQRIIDKYQSALVCFGGADPLNLSLKAVKALLTHSTVSKINVVLGASYVHSEISDLSKHSSKISVHRNLSESDLLKCMQESDFAIASASNILYELCAVKMPVLSGYYVDNQKKLYQGCIDNNLIFGMGSIEHFSENDFEKQIATFFKSENKQNYLHKQSALFDGEIKNRFLNMLSELTYRKAELKDMELVFNWSNDALTRANSYNSEPILFETHKQWFESKLKAVDSYLFIAQRGQVPVGLVRYDIKSDHAVVGILLDEKHRGKGYAVDMLRDSARIYFKSGTLPIQAYIKEGNLASVKSFQKAGYQFLKKETVQQHPSVIYQLSKNDVQ